MAQLVEALPGLAKDVEDVLDSNHSIVDQDFRNQFEKLYRGPLQKSDSKSKNIVIVIDALDECDSQTEISDLLRLLSKPLYYKQNGRDTPVKYFLTGRHDGHSLSRLQRLHPDQIENCHNPDLEELTAETIGDDIKRFLKFRLQEVPALWDGDKDPWANAKNVDTLGQLVTKACPLFEFAATACRLIEDDNLLGDAKSRLYDILATKCNGDLDHLYWTVLNTRLRSSDDKIAPRRQKMVEEQFRRVIGSVMSLADPVSVSCLAHLLGETKAMVVNELRHFKSVLDVPSNDDRVIKIFHESFRDFFHGSAQGEFGLDERKTHEHLALRCRELLCGKDGKKDALRENFCELESPGAYRREIPEKVLCESISPEVQYACRFWVHHLKNSDDKIKDNDAWYQLLHKHFLHWLEALGLLGRISESVQFVKELQTLVESNAGTQIEAFLKDAERFICKFCPIVNEAPLQLYISGLTFAPTESIIRRTFDTHRPMWITRLPEVGAHWSPCLQTLPFSVYDNACLVSSSEGLLAVGHEDGDIEMWDPIAGIRLKFFDPSSGSEPLSEISSLALSQTGKLACATETSIIVWDITQDNHLNSLTLNRDEGKVISMAFRNGQHLLFATIEGKIASWDIGNGPPRHLEICCNLYKPILSNDGRWIAGFDELGVTLIATEAKPGCPPKKLTLDAGRKTSIMRFSPGGQYLAIAYVFHEHQNLGNVEVWDTVSTQRLQSLDTGLVWSLAVSADNRRLATAKKEIVIWDWENGSRLQVFDPGDEIIDSLAFSPKGSWLASSDEVNGVQIWDVAASYYGTPGTPGTHRSCIKSIAMSMDGERLISGSLSRYELWEKSGSICFPQPLHGGESWYERREGLYEPIVAISANGEVVAMNCESGVEIQNLKSGICLPLLPRNWTRLYSMTLSANGERLLLGLKSGPRVGGCGLVWSTSKGKRLKEIDIPLRRWVDVGAAMSLDGQKVALVFDSTVHVENLCTNQLLKRKLLRVTQAAFSEDGQRVAALSQTCDGGIWEVETGVCLRRFRNEDPNGVLCLDIKLIDVDFAVAGDLPEQLPLMDCLIDGGYVSHDCEWLMKGTNRVLRLPRDSWPTCTAVSKAHIAVGLVSGHAFVVGMAWDNIPGDCKAVDVSQDSDEDSEEDSDEESDEDSEGDSDEESDEDSDENSDQESDEDSDENSDEESDEESDEDSEEI
ncbi:hypothetical protein CDD82_2975 [Ophiocordyceps australis]|uniref:Mitochondrial division protein 1 n=1 Tax=Ophiocordyceps australis TaxID=1399860 RepID=A0A2C5ZBZ4_9HYPO|nr:hypothetical protein CDD82_2975 [Ophiocordyceps australis]